MLCAESKVGEHPEAARAASIAAKSLWRPEAKGFRDAFLRAVKVRDVVSPKGIYTGRAPSYDVDYRRIHSVVERITLGLYFWEFEQPMPSELAVSVLDGMSINRSPKTEREAVERIAGKFAGSDFHSRAGGCFKFARKSIDESVGHIWSMRFFDGFDFIAAAYDQREHGPMYYGPEYVDELRYDSRGT
ncbi:hypothetical protein HNQ40_002927 [Algisphaera agarilytica]|uniref:Uncharacterized protein n=1 Tax=Algisphaera agarilytica TaxID=1385975 RepID=A0A7X0HAG1_9BACT|nr:hypothetical protein [Algisphaera agarilytica]